MLSSFITWWIARIAELVPRSWIDSAVRPRDGIIVDLTHGLTASIRQRGLLEPVSLGVAARMAGKRAVLVRPPEEAVLVKQHVVPSAPKHELDQLLGYELGRITPFPAEELFWSWEGQARPGDRTRIDVVITMVPKLLLAPALAVMEDNGLKANFVEVGPPAKARLLAVSDRPGRSAIQILVRGLAWGCAGLAVIAICLPLVLQALALNATNTAITDLQPAMKQVESLRHGMTAGAAGREALASELKRTGDLLEVLATITRILPDDTFLTDFSLRDRQMTISGRSASAPRLITSLSADPAMRNTAFAAPVTRIEGAASDVFSIKAEVAP